MAGARAEAKGIVLRPGQSFNGIKVFSATMVADRDQLGEKITAWIAANPQYQVVEIVITQSSDERFHCVAFSIFYYEELRATSSRPAQPPTTGVMPRKAV
jgi:hypothetical protein